MQIRTQEDTLSRLKELEKAYLGTTASLILHTNGAGAVRLDRHLSLPPVHIGINFDAIEDVDQTLDHLAQLAAERL